MKFSLESDLDFEAETRDEALLKLATHFMSLMDRRPAFFFDTKKPVDALGTLIQNGPTLNEPTTDGYIDVDVHGDFEPPAMLQ